MGAAKRVKRRTTKRRTTKRRTRKRTTRRRKVTRKRRVTKKRRRRTAKKRVVRKRRKKRVSKRGSRIQVWNGTKESVKTTGQKKTDLMKNKRGKVVSKKANTAGKKTYKRNGLDKWTKAFMQARKNLGLKGFVACKKGTAFYKEARRIYDA